MDHSYWRCNATEAEAKMKRDKNKPICIEYFKKEAD